MTRIDEIEIKIKRNKFKEKDDLIEEARMDGCRSELERVIYRLSFRRDCEEKGSFPYRVINAMIEEVNRGAY